MHKKKTRSERFITAVLMVILFQITLPSYAQDYVTSAEQAIAIDFDTGAVLFEKDADKQIPTASMSKVLSIYLVFEALKAGRLKLDNELLVSEKAWKMKGSKMWVPINEKVKVEDLIRGVVIQSGNDAFRAELR